jgi:hypothetical protein
MTGKTCFLALLFHLRVAANLPTLYMSDEVSMILYKNRKLGELQNTSSITLLLNMPEETWCLIDSNVPGFIENTQFFIVQATSPRQKRMEYVKKLHGDSQLCLMSPWSLRELIMGYV